MLYLAFKTPPHMSNGNRGYLIATIIVSTIFGTIIGFFADNTRVGFILGMGVGVTVGTVISANANKNR